MKIFATEYPETITEGFDGINDWSWMPIAGYQDTRGKPTKTMVNAGGPGPLSIFDQTQ